MAEQPLSSDHEAASVLSAPTQRAPPDMPWARRRPWSGITLVRLAVLITAGVIVVLFATQCDRWVGLAVRQVTDDAYVRGDITPLSAQIEGYVRRVPVDDFQRVKEGEVLVEIEDDDYRARVAQAEADLYAAKAEARGIEAEARSRRWKLQRAVEDLDNQIALLHARVAALDKSKAVLTLAQIDFGRAKQLLGTPAESRQQYDRAQRALLTADAQVNEALAQVYQARASLGLPAQPTSGEDLGQVPPDLDQTFSSVLEAQADLIQSAAQLGVIHSYAQSPKQMLDEFAKQGDIDRYFAQLTTEAPAVKQAEAKLDLAKINLGYTRISAPAGGEVSERDVRAGQYVHAGSQVITVVPDNVWVVANYKETQLTHVAIGQRAEIRV
ncbi:MAG TPA: efflux RND transporter periplasmic adaptor subunit, partial [Stellaceae bacterium]|nr:efflux RND transporter periplasmic adaptor subunit [Stellaceae bacterium]